MAVAAHLGEDVDADVRTAALGATDAERRDLELGGTEAVDVELTAEADRALGLSTEVRGDR
jgi:hypothetical protein